MLISKVVLFETPLDLDYNNVIDVDKDPEFDTIYNILIDTYPHRIVTPTIKSVKHSNSKAFITVRENYEWVRRYNYCVVFQEDSIYQYYFIESVISENNGIQSSATTLQLKWDAWANNIYYFKDVPNNILTSHMDRFTPVYGANEDVVGIEPRFYIKNNNVKLDTRKGELDPFNRQMIPLFCAITYKELGLYPNVPNTSGAYGLMSEWRTLSGQTYIVYVGDSLNGRMGRKVVYCFLGLYSVELNKLVQTDVSSAASISLTDGQTLTSLNYTLNPDVSRLFNEDFTDYIENVRLTFNCPFPYRIYGQSIIFDNYICKLPLLFKDISQDNNFDLPLAIVGDGSVDKVTGAGTTAKVADFRFSFPINNEHSYIRYKDYTYGDVYDSDFTDLPVNVTEPLSYIKPFNNVYLTANDRVIDYPFINDEAKYVELTLINETPQPQLRVEINNALTPFDKNIFIDDSGYVSFGVDSLASFNNRNGARMGLNILSKGVAAVAGVIGAFNGGGTGALVSGVKNALDIVKQSGTIIDADRTPDTFNVQTGECDIRYQDRVRLITEKCDTSSIMYKETMKFYYIYGYTFTRMASPFTNVRYAFDYCKTIDCNLSSLRINNEDRIELENAFNRGITKWHAHLDGNYAVADFESDMIKDSSTMLNYETKFFTDPALIAWREET